MYFRNHIQQNYTYCDLLNNTMLEKVKRMYKVLLLHDVEL